MRPVVEFVIPVFLNCSTCLSDTPLIIRSSKTVKPEAAITVFELLMMSGVSLKHVEQLRNTGITNSTTGRILLVIYIRFKSNFLVKRAFFLYKAACAMTNLDLNSRVHIASYVTMLHKQFKCFTSSSCM